MTQPSIVRDCDGSVWHLQEDGTYNLRTTNDFLAGVYQSYELDQIRDEFGIRSQTFDTPQGDQDYSYLRTSRR